MRFLFEDGSRIIFRLSGTGSAGATIRMYLEQYTNDPTWYDKPAEEAFQSLVALAFQISQLKELTGRTVPTVIT